MNVREAIEASPIRAARHEKGRVLTESDPSIIWCARNMRSGWQPLAVLDETAAVDGEYYKALADRYKARIAELKEQLAGEYTLGEPLTEATNGDRYVAVRKLDGTFKQGHFSYSGKVDNAYWDYYADPRPWPKLPEKKPRYTYRDCGECFRIERDGKDFCAVEYRSDAELLVKLLNESEGE